jgi:hypothetical protein
VWCVARPSLPFVLCVLMCKICAALTLHIICVVLSLIALRRPSIIFGLRSFWVKKYLRLYKNGKLRMEIPLTRPKRKLGTHCLTLLTQVYKSFIVSLTIVSCIFILFHMSQARLTMTYGVTVVLRRKKQVLKITLGLLSLSTTIACLRSR